MQDWLNFWVLLFFISILGFLFNPSNFISLVFFSEISWLILYVLSLNLGCYNDDLNLISFSFLILGLAGVEFSFAFLLLILFKNYNISLNFFYNNKELDSFLYKNKKNLKINSFIWV